MKNSTLFLLTDAPPLRETAFGNHGIAANLVEIIGDDCTLVISHRYRRSISPAEIKAASTRPIYLYPDSAVLGVKRFAPGLADVIDVLGAWIGRWRVVQFARERRPTRMFALVGGNGWFLISIWLIATATRLPFDIYLVDDLEDSAVLWRRRWLRRLIRPLEQLVLDRAHHVFAISKGYVEHLGQKYGRPAEWLPPPMKIESFVYRPYARRAPDVRHIVFVGGVSNLYTPALVELYSAIQEHNLGGSHYRLRLLLITTAGAEAVLARIPNQVDLEIMSRLPREQLDLHCSESWATFLPYSFDPTVRNLVSTSFSWKLSDSYRAGRPILVFGPEYASIPRYFREAGLPLCATSPEQLRVALSAIEKEDSPELIARYAETWQRFHSPEAIRAKIGLAPRFEAIPELSSRA